MTFTLEQAHKLRKFVKIADIVLTMILVQIFALNFSPVSYCMGICKDGWEEYIDYEMLSDELRGIISEDELLNGSPEARLAMYQKLENMPSKKYKASTSATSAWIKPCVDFLETDGKKYRVDIQIDLGIGYPQPEVVNFITHIQALDK